MVLGRLREVRDVQWPAVVVVLTVLPLLVPVFQPGWFLGHDNLHLLRLFEQDLMIRAGHFPVRWYPDVAAGFGSPHPQFYAPLFYLIAQGFLLFSFSLDLSLKLAVAVILLASGFGMYGRCARGWVRPADSSQRWSIPMLRIIWSTSTFDPLCPS